MSKEEQEQKLKKVEDRQTERRERKEVVKQESAQARIDLRQKNKMIARKSPQTE